MLGSPDPRSLTVEGRVLTRGVYASMGLCSRGELLYLFVLVKGTGLLCYALPVLPEVELEDSCAGTTSPVSALPCPTQISSLSIITRNEIIKVLGTADHSDADEGWNNWTCRAASAAGWSAELLLSQSGMIE